MVDITTVNGDYRWFINPLITGGPHPVWMSYVFHLSWTYYTDEIQVYKHFADWIPSRYCVAWINRFLLFVATTNMPFKLRPAFTLPTKTQMQSWPLRESSILTGFDRRCPDEEGWGYRYDSYAASSAVSPHHISPYLTIYVHSDCEQTGARGHVWKQRLVSIGLSASFSKPCRVMVKPLSWSNCATS